MTWSGGRFTCAESANTRTFAIPLPNNADGSTDVGNNGLESRRTHQRHQFTEYMQHRKLYSGEKSGYQ
jgi:hypothetical protein